ncbi:HAD-IA family hydrolase [Pseudaeromonas paramecii]|uniref:HAD-IA family hydrolase n=1 Tax=Pseudaeromonas paramecii TaxID=2138166 RepID=A0ABP8PTG4_9GAMM
MRRFELVIFDWDGTLMDSVGRIVSSMQSAAIQVGRAVPEADAVRNIVGLSLQEALPRLFGPLDELGYQQLLQAYRQQYVHDDPTPTPLFTGVASTLHQLAERGHLLAVATGKARAGLDRVLAETGFSQLFHASRGADEARSKPDPMMLEQLLAQLNVPLEQAVMVGDSCYDMEMAANLGMARIGVDWGVHAAPILKRFTPLAVISSMDELLALV